ncbi:MAG: glycine cleavage T C-terminal barrel domain-containing protein, partial [Pseudomonadota bacterium]
QLLELEEGGGDPFSLHPVFAGDKVAGLITSGAFGHRTGKSLALAYLKPEGQAAGASLTAGVLGHEVPARVLTEVPYDPRNERLKG